MKLQADFFNDWIEILKKILINWDYDISGISNEEIPLIYFNVEQRLVQNLARNIKYSTSFTCPSELETRWTILKNKIETGKDITTYLSKLVLRPTITDSLLNDWGVHHFHLGEELEGDFISRTGPLLFALVRQDTFYAIGIFGHGEWANEDIVEIIHSNWPEVISKYKTQDNVEISNHPSPEDRLKLRKNEINSFFECTDGTIYMPIGGGMSTSGYNVESTMRMIQQKKRLNHLQDFLEKELPKLKEEFEKQGYSGEEAVEAKLQITENKYKALFPAYNLSIILDKRA